MKLVVIGSHGHAGVVIDALSRFKTKIDGLVDDYRGTGYIAHGLPVICAIDEIPDDVTHYIIAIGDNAGRRQVYDKVKVSCPKAVPIPLCDISVIGRFSIGGGTFVAQGACIGNNTKIGQFSIINTRASVDHDCTIGDFVHLAPGVVTGGHVTIGDNTFIGIGAMIRDHITIGNNCTIGMGSVVLHDVPSDVHGFGNPFRITELHNCTLTEVKCK